MCNAIRGVFYRSIYPDLSARLCDAFLGISLGNVRWSRPQLKYRCLLTLAKAGQNYDLSIRQFERIVVLPLFGLLSSMT